MHNALPLAIFKSEDEEKNLNTCKYDRKILKKDLFFNL